MENTNNIVIDKFEYQNLVKSALNYEILINALFESCDLTYHKDDLDFNTGCIKELLKTISEEKYNLTLRYLKEKAEENDNN